MTSTDTTQSQRPAFPGQIVPGSQVFLSKTAAAGNQLQALARSYIVENFGGEGPFSVARIEGETAVLRGGTLSRPATLALSSLTLDKPLTRMNALEALTLPSVR